MLTYFYHCKFVSFLSTRNQVIIMIITIIIIIIIIITTTTTIINVILFNTDFAFHIPLGDNNFSFLLIILIR